MNMPRSATLVGACLLLFGCSSGTANYRSQMADTPARPVARPRADVPPAPDLRIPASAVASAPDIPLVPVPPVPLGHGAPSQPPADGPRPNLAATQPPVLPPVPAPSSGTPGANATRLASANAPAAPPSTDVAPKAASLRELQQQAASWYAGVDSYIVRMTRREVVSGTAKPEEVLMLSFRKAPWSVHLKWVGKAGQGREVLYVKGQLENKLHTRLAAGDVPFTPAGMQMDLDVNSPLVRSASRHSITDAGLGSCIDRLGALLDAQEHGDRSRGVLTDLGMQTRPEYKGRPVRGVELTLPPGAEAELPRGGKRLYFFDPDLHVPMLILTFDDKNQEVEYYHYDRLIAPAALDADDFNPEKLWGGSKMAGK